MEPFTFDSGRLKGVEVLFFDDVEIQKVKGNSTSFASSGSLSVLYFKNFDRFVLRLNDWVYPLMRRIPITSESGAGSSSTFTFPALNGFSYRLVFNNTEGQAFSNFQTILSNNSGFSVPGVQRAVEASPDDKLMRKRSKDSTTTSTITNLIKSGYDKVKHATMGLGGTKNLTSTKKRMNVKDIKNKNYRKSAHSSFKKDYFESELKMTKKFLDHRRENPNLTQSKSLSELKKTSDSSAPSLFFLKDQIEEAILNQKDLISQRNFTVSESTHKTGIVDSIKGGLSNIKQQVTNMVQREAPKDNTLNQPQGQQGLVEGMTHYSG